MDDKTIKQVVTWLVHSDEIPLAELAGVLGVPTNRLRRWADVQKQLLTGQTLAVFESSQRLSISCDGRSRR